MKMKITFENVSKIYNKESIGLEDANFSIQQGEFVFVIGRSGAGKSTLLNLISGEVRPSSGVIRIGDIETSKLKEKEIPLFKRKIGKMDAQVGLLKDKTIYQNLYFVLHAIEEPRITIKPKIKKALSIVGMAQREEAYPEELSVGEIARVLLARAIILNPQILIIDEPTANMSAGLAWDMMYLLQELNKQGITLIVASHSRELVTVMEKRVITLVSGMIVSDEKRGIYDARKMDVIEEKRVKELRKMRSKG